MDSDDTQRHRLLELLRQFGWNATSFQLLEPDFDYWFGEASCVGFVSTRFADVAAGAPIAADHEVGAAADAFVAQVRKRKRRVAFFGVERRLLEATSLDSVVVGEQPWWNPQEWSERRRAHRSIREQIRRARAKGIRVQQLSPTDLADEANPVRQRIDRLIERWSASRAMPPMQFLVALHPFSFAEERIYFGAVQGEELVGMLVAVPIYQRNGWFLEDLLRDPAAPNGTAESLVDAAMSALAERGCDYATLGLAPLSSDVPWLRLSRRILSGFYNFDGLRAFKAKLAPNGWDPIYLAYPRGSSALLALYDVLDAFSSGAMIRFGIRSIFRASPFTLRLLGWALLPWTLLLFLSPTSRWFPNIHVQSAWVAFDLLMCAGLLKLAKRWRPALARLMATAATLDLALTALQVALFNLPRRQGVTDSVVIALSLLAPLFASFVLWGGVKRHSME
jgi:phosphatidylglycerol lysyltransferase